MTAINFIGVTDCRDMDLDWALSKIFPLTKQDSDRSRKDLPSTWRIYAFIIMARPSSIASSTRRETYTSINSSILVFAVSVLEGGLCFAFCSGLYVACSYFCSSTSSRKESSSLHSKSCISTWVLLMGRLLDGALPNESVLSPLHSRHSRSANWRGRLE